MTSEEIMKMQVEKSAEMYAIKVERYIRLHIRPKPKYLPKILWELLLKRMLVMEEFEKTLE